MNATDQAHYRLRLAEGFLKEAHQDIASHRWRSCADNSQLAAEHAAKAVLGLLGPIGRTHSPSVFLRRALKENRLPEAQHAQVEKLPECARTARPRRSH